MDNRIKQILRSMDIPPKRIETLDIRNVSWLMNNVWIRNGKHQDFPELKVLLLNKMRELQEAND